VSDLYHKMNDWEMNRLCSECDVQFISAKSLLFLQGMHPSSLSVLMNALDIGSNGLF
jgi:hypothetical protein